MNMLMFAVSTCVILGIIGHAFFVVMKDTKAVYNMNVATAKKKMFGPNVMVSTSTVKKELRRQRILNAIGIVLGILTIITIVGIAGHHTFNIIMANGSTL